jgi:methylenetetrahydrofolate--tRNA-(uracil-5-)-methyltransferase
VLDELMRLKADPRLRFAGQITGVEGYVESAAMGLVTGRLAAAERRGRQPVVPPATTALGALVNHITGGHLVHDFADQGDGVSEPGNPSPASSSSSSKRRSFQPMNINYGLLPPTEAPKFDAEGKRIKGKDKGFAKKRAASERALRDLSSWLEANDLRVAAA